jgi:PAS domain S-box-containing protein
MKTSRRPAGDLSHQAWEPFRQFFEQNDEAILVFAPDTCAVIDLNPAACRLFGSTHEELIDRGLELFCEPDELDNLKHIICTSDPVVRTYVMTYSKCDGTKSVLRFRSNRIRLRDGELIYCPFRDIGEEIRLKEENRFRQAQLIHANKMAALGILVTSVAHEISNPNNFIMHNNQVLAETWKDVFPVLREYYRENGDYYLGGIPLSEFDEVIPKLVYGIQDGSERIRNIVQNLRDFVRSDRARLDSMVDLAAVVANAITLMRAEIGKHTNAFSLQVIEHLPPVKGSAQKLEQVVINLLLNALQSLNERGQCVTVAIEFDEKSDQCLLKVSDEGAGMSEEVMNRITEPFFSTKLDRGGTGLGLYISNSIIREHKGTIVFTSEPGAGTTVTVRLPAFVKKAENDYCKEPTTTDIAS